MMGSKIVRFGAALTLAALALPAGAQDSRSRLDRNQGKAKSVSRTDPATAVLVAHDFAQCVARREGKGLRKALDLPLNSPEQTKGLKNRTDQFEGCLGNAEEFDQLVYVPILMAGGAAEYLYNTGLDRVDLSPLAGMTDEDLAKTAFAPRNSLEDLGLCIVRRGPDRARTFVATRVNSQEEMAAFRVSSKDVGPCLTQGQTATLNKASLRAVLAYALYRAADKQGTPGA